MRAIGLDPASASPEDMRAQIDKAIREVDQGEGVLVLVDMFGGTPSNLSLAFLEEGRVEVVTGVNLPMLVKVARQKAGIDIHELAETRARLRPAQHLRRQRSARRAGSRGRAHVSRAERDCTIRTSSACTCAPRRRS